MNAWEGYRILEVSPRASWEEIRSRFRVLVNEYHPDRNSDNPDAADQFRQVVEAYETIRAARARSRKREKQYYHTHFTVQTDLFEEFFGITRSSPHTKTTGPDFRYDLSIPFTAAIQGMETTIEVPRVQACPHCGRAGRTPVSHQHLCPDCQGKGYRALGPGLLKRMGPACQRCQGRGALIENSCLACEGTGYRSQFQSYHLKIPAGIEEGARFCFRGEGGEGFQNGPPGDLEVVISVEPHAFFTRKGKDLHCKFEISFVQAALGGVVYVPTLNGFQSLSLPQGTQSGRIFRFPGAGAPAGANKARGDQVVEVLVKTPERLAPDQRKLLKEFQRLEQEGLSFAAHE